MSKEIFDWANDEELSANSKIINMPLSTDAKAEKIINDLENGFHFSDSGLLQKEIAIPETNVVYYDPKKIRTDDKGRNYFFDEQGNRKYFDELGNIYGIRTNENGENEEEYMILDNNEILTFTDSTHRVGMLADGSVYVYNDDEQAYDYDPNIIIHPNTTFKR